MTAPSGQYPFEGRVVLVAEDEPIIRFYIDAALKGMGFKVLIACDGIEALEVANRHGGAIDLLLTDVKMPRMDGLELMRILQQKRPEMKVLIMSGYASSRLRELASRTNFLEKPFLPNALRAKIKQILLPVVP